MLKKKEYPKGMEQEWEEGQTEEEAGARPHRIRELPQGEAQEGEWAGEEAQEGEGFSPFFFLYFLFYFWFIF